MSGIYIHIPFCKSKCAYCDFYSVAIKSFIPDFCKALLSEISLRKNIHSFDTVNTIYFGGGTPSGLNIELVSKILNHIEREYNISRDAEITFEANPEDLTKEYLRSLKMLGVNRLSVGIQSFNDSILQFLKRRHSATDAIMAVENAYNIGIKNISVDLIYGITGRTNLQWKNELCEAFRLPISHLSCYNLGVEQGTLLFRYVREKKYMPADDDFCFNQFKIFSESIAENNWNHYEISNSCKPGFESKHNSSYWNRTPYLGFGPSAHSFFENKRFRNFSNVADYIKNIAENKTFFESEILDINDVFNETVMLGLRTNSGISLSEIEKEFGEEKSAKVKKIIANLNPFHVKFDGDKLTLTTEGLFVSDGIIEDFFEV